MYEQIFTIELQDRVYGHVTVNYNSFIGGYEIRIGTPNLYFSDFISDKDIDCSKNPFTLIEQVVIKYELEILKHFIKRNGV